MTARTDMGLPEGARKAVATMWKHQADSRSPEQDEKADILRSLDQQIAELNRQLDAARVSGRGHDNTEFAALEQNASRLLALRQNVEGAQSAAVLAQLKPQVVEALRVAGDATQAGAASIAGSTQSAAFSTRQLAQAEFYARMTTIEREVAPIYQRMDQARTNDDRLAARYGVNVTPWNSFDDSMKAGAAEKRKNGDRVGALEDDMLRSFNAVQRSQALIDAMPDGEEKQRKQAEQQKQIDDAAKMVEAVRKAHEAQIEKEAAERVAKGESPDAAAEWKKAELKDRMDKTMDRVKQIQATKGLSNSDMVDAAVARAKSWQGENKNGERSEGMNETPTPAYLRAQDAAKVDTAMGKRSEDASKRVDMAIGIASLPSTVKSQIEQAKPETKVAVAETAAKPEAPSPTPAAAESGKGAGAAKA